MKNKIKRKLERYFTRLDIFLNKYPRIRSFRKWLSKYWHLLAGLFLSVATVFFVLWVTNKFDSEEIGLIFLVLCFAMIARFVYDNDPEIL